MENETNEEENVSPSENQQQNVEVSNRKKYSALFVLLLINLLNYIDRYTIVGIMERLKLYFGMNDKDSGLLQTVFIGAYMFTAPVFGYFGDRYNRKLLIIVGMVIWLLAVTLSSFCSEHHFYLFLLSRGIVGVGEASYTTLAPTILSDLFKGTARSRVYMIFYFAVPVGSGLGFILGSRIALWSDSWQWGVRFSPFVGVVTLVMLIFLLEEPVRGASEGVREQGDDGTLWEDLKYFANIKTYVYTTLGSIASFFTIGSMSWWIPQYIGYAYAQMHHQPKVPDDESARINLVFGVITCLAGIFGVLVGSLVSRAWQDGKWCFGRYKTQKAECLVCAISMFIALPFIFAALIVSEFETNVSLTIFYFGIMSLCMSMAIIVDILMAVVVPNRRSLALAVQTLLAHLFGDASSPYIVGVLSDAFRGDDASIYGHFFALQKALYLPTFALIAAGAFFLVSTFSVVRDRKEALFMMEASEEDWPRALIDEEPLLNSPDHHDHPAVEGSAV